MKPHVSLRRILDRFLSMGPGAGMFSAGIVILSGEAHSVGYVLSGIACIWAGAAWIGYIPGEKA